MIGFVSALSASLAIMVLVVLSALIGYVQSILPTTGLIRLDEYTYRYVQEDVYIEPRIIGEVILEIDLMGLTNDVVSYQVGCNHGFNQDSRQATEIATFNYLTINNYFDEKVKIGNIKVEEFPDGFNICYVDINMKRGDNDG